MHSSAPPRRRKQTQVPLGAARPLFLQELAHLSSLACTVALSTLRNNESVSR